MTAFVAVALAATGRAVVTTPGVVVATRLGRISGTVEMLRPEDGYPGTSRFFYGFRGVPYARAPVGRLRWKVLLFWLLRLFGGVVRSGKVSG